MTKFYSLNPATGKKIQEYSFLTSSEIESKIERADQLFKSEWRKKTFAERSKKTRQLGVILRDRADEFARLMADEMGKPIAQGKAEAEKCAWVCDYYADHAQTFLAPELIKTDATKSYVAYEPLGILLAIMPWNFPFWQVFRAAVPALMAGNVVILKHANNVPGCGEALEKIFLEAGFPVGAFQNLLIDVAQVESVIQHTAVRAVTLTGSTRAGRSVGKIAGSVLKKVVLELGGSDPYILLKDAKLEEAIKACGTSRMINSGQSCIAAKRFIVVKSLHDSFVKGLVQMMKEYSIGDPHDEKTKLGPMARKDLRDSLHEQVLQSVEKGAKIVLGGKIPDREGAFYPATILTNVKKGMKAYEEELFGPVASVICVKDEKEAIQIANDTNFGLGAALFTQDLERAQKIAEHEIQAGSVFINDFVRSDPRLPFGGIGESGYGRELAAFGIREFVNIKTISLK